MSKTKKKRLTAYFLMLSMCGLPAAADVPVPSSSVTPNTEGAYIYVDSGSTDFDFNVDTVSGWTGSTKGAVVNDNSGQALTLTGTGSGGSQTYSNNQSDGNGGAMSILGTGSSVTFSGSSVFSGNSAAANGGAIYNTAEATINGNSSFTGNTAGTNGGAIYNVGNLYLNTTDGNITFSGNTASGLGNDIYLDNSSVMTISGGNKVTLGSGIYSEGTTPSVININGTATNGSELVLNGNSTINGNVAFANSSKLTNNATSTIAGTISGAGEIVNNNNKTLTLSGSSADLNLTNNGTANLSGNFSGATVSNTNTLNVSSSGSNTTNATFTNSGTINVTGNAAGSLTNDKNLVVDGGSYSGSVIQNAVESAITVKNNGKLTTSSVLDKGSITFTAGGYAVGNVQVTDAVNVILDSYVYDSTGLRTVGTDDTKGRIVGSSLSFDDKAVSVAEGESIVSDLTLSGTATLTTPSGDVNIGDGTSTNTVTFTDGITTETSTAYKVNDNATLKLAPAQGKSVTINSDIKGTGNVKVDEILVDNPSYDSTQPVSATNQPYKHLQVGTVNLSGNNKGFTGLFTQVMGTVKQAAGKFFGGDNVIEGGSLTIANGASLEANSLEVKGGTVNIEGGATIETTVAADVKGGTLNLKNGAIVNSDTINSTTGAGTYGTVNIYNVLDSNPAATMLEDEDGNALFDSAILATDLANGNDASFKYLNAGDTTKNITVTNGAGLGLFNGTMIQGEDISGVADDAFAMQDDKGVRDLTLGDGAGIYAQNIILGDNTYLTYMDRAYIRDNSDVSMGSKAELTFANNTTDVLYNSIITSAATDSVINKRNAGETVITSTLKDFHGSVNVTGGLLDLQNEDAVTFNNITVKNSEMHSASQNVNATGDVTVTNSTAFEIDSDLIVTGNTSVTGSDAKIAGDLTSKNVTLKNTNMYVDNDLNVQNQLKVDGYLLDVKNDISADTSVIKNAVVNVAGDFTSTTSTSIADTKLNVTGYSDLGTTTISGDNSVINLVQGATLNSLTFTDNGLFTTPANVDISGALTIGNAAGTDNPTFNLTSGNINTITANSIVLNSNANISIDADPRSKAIDSIVANSITQNNGAQMIITGVQFTQTPIDRKVDIDVTKLLNAPETTPSMVRLATGSVVTETEMGTYLLSASSSAAANTLSATLLKVNPQMYRGQVATSATYANQLVVNNMLLEHTSILANDLIARDRNANRFAAANPVYGPYQYSKKDGDLWYKAYGNFERITMTQGLHVGNNAYGSLIGADFPAVEVGNGWTIVPTGYVAYNGGHQHYSGVSMYQDGGQVGAMATAYKGDFITSLLAYGGGYHNHMSVHGPIGYGTDDNGNWFAGVASKTAYNIHLPADLILQPTGLVSYNIFGNQNYHSDFGNMSMNAGFLNGINVAPGLNLILNKKTFSFYGTAQLVFNIMGDVSGKAGNVDLEDVRMKTTYFEYGLGAMKRFKDTFNAYLQFTIRNGYRTGIGFQGGLQWRLGKKNSKTK